jgi:phosphoribosyl 1,2-cyclic phosphodiesterase
MNFKTIHSSSSANLYTVENRGGKLLIEAGLRGRALKRALNYTLASFGGCLVSHVHGDHSRGCQDVLNAGIDCYMTFETANKLGLSGHHRLHIIKPLKQFTVGAWIIKPFPTEHDCPGSVGFLIENSGEKMVFITDSYYCMHTFKRLNIIAIECNYSEATLNPESNSNYMYHFSLERVKKFLESNDLSVCREIHLLHLSDENSDEEYFEEEIKKLTGVPVYIAGK